MDESFNDFFNKFIFDNGKIIYETKEQITKLYIEGRITKTEFLERMKKIDERKK